MKRLNVSKMAMLAFSALNAVKGENIYAGRPVLSSRKDSHKLQPAWTDSAGQKRGLLQVDQCPVRAETPLPIDPFVPSIGDNGNLIYTDVAGEQKEITVRIMDNGEVTDEVKPSDVEMRSAFLGDLKKFDQCIQRHPLTFQDCRQECNGLETPENKTTITFNNLKQLLAVTPLEVNLTRVLGVESYVHSDGVVRYPPHASYVYKIGDMLGNNKSICTSESGVAGLAHEIGHAVNHALKSISIARSLIASRPEAFCNFEEERTIAEVENAALFCGNEISRRQHFDFFGVILRDAGIPPGTVFFCDELKCNEGQTVCEIMSETPSANTTSPGAGDTTNPSPNVPPGPLLKSPPPPINVPPGP